MRSAALGTPPDQRRENVPLALLSICGAVALATTMDGAVKWLSGDYPVHQLLVLRCAAATPVLLFILGLRWSELIVIPPQWPMILLRAVIMATGYLSFVLAIAAIPLADAVAMYFTMPLIVAALAGPLLGEKVPLARWAVITIGFLGVLVMIRPGAGVFEPAALFALWAAFAYGTGQMLTRRIGFAVRPSVIAFHQNIIYLAIGALLSLVFGFGQFATETHPSLAFMVRGWSAPPLFDLTLMLSLGILSGTAMVLFTQAYRLAEANLVAPFEYTGMFWATFYGLVLFGDFPDLATGLGAALVIGAGLYMLAGDRRSPR